MTAYILKRSSDLTRENSKFNFFGIHGTAAAGATTNIDGKFSQERYVDGGHVTLKGHVRGDRFTIQVVDKDNVLGGGAGLVLGERATAIAVQSDVENQGEQIAPYLSLIPPYLYFRIIYTSTGLVPVDVSLHLRTHIPADVT